MRQMDEPGCVNVFGLSRGQLAAFRYHGRMDLRPASGQDTCPWLLVAAHVQPSTELTPDMGAWQLVSSIRRPVDPDDNVLLYRKIAFR
jgi:hypothetical protein